MEGKHEKIDMICPSFVTPFKPGKRIPGLSQMISMKKNFFPLFFFLSNDINTYSSGHDHETPNVNYLLSSIIICGRHHFFSACFNLSKTRYTLLPEIKIINKLLCFNQATLLIW